MNTLPFHIALAAECITSWAPGIEALQYVKNTGCTHVQLDVTQFPHKENFTIEEARQLRDALDDHGLIGDTMSTWPHEFGASLYGDYLRRIAQAAPVLGLRIMNTYLWPFVKQTDEQTLDHYAQVLRPALDVAADNGLTLTIEPEAHDLSRNVAGLKKILDVVNHPSLRVNYDPCNLYNGCDEGFPYGYFELKEHTAFVHLKNGCVFREGTDPPDEKGVSFAAPWQDRYIRWGPIDQGTLDIGAIVRQLVQDRYTGVVVLEPHAGDGEKRQRFFAQEIAFMRSMADESGA